MMPFLIINESTLDDDQQVGMFGQGHLSSVCVWSSIAHDRHGLILLDDALVTGMQELCNPHTYL